MQSLGTPWIMTRSIADKEMKLLWGRAAGRCSICQSDLTLELESGRVTSMGEMAHIIAHSASGPRGGVVPLGGLNSYGNLILLCPTHHAIVDRSPDQYPIERLISLKAAHERDIRGRLAGPVVTTKTELMREVSKLLSLNFGIWKQFGPESDVAAHDPTSSASEIWEARKLSQIVPNNTKIVNLFDNNLRLLSPAETTIFVEFREHAAAFERNCYQALDQLALKRFPVSFASMVSAGCADG